MGGLGGLGDINEVFSDDLTDYFRIFVMSYGRLMPSDVTAARFNRSSFINFAIFQK